MSDQPPILNEVDTYGPVYMRVANQLGRYEGNEEEAPLVIDLDSPGRAFDADWDGALSRIASRTRPPSGTTSR